MIIKKSWKRHLAGICAVMLSIMPMAGTSLQNTEKVSAAGNILAFPGAVGAGKYATGGRGGEVYHVTNLNDSGAGSFRDAVSQSGRIVVFDVSGTIELKSNILCQSNITIAGQTAPGGSGITLKNYKMGMSGDNIICRFISSRPGPYASTSSGNDAWGGAKGSNSIIDHCSMGWTTDEQWGLYSNNEYYTVQYSVLGPADSWGGHAKGLHGFGIMMGKGYLTFDHNLIIHNVSRNFRGKVEGQETADFTNNIIYDWGYQTAYGTIGHLNYVNNTLKAGNSTTGGYHWMYVDSGTKPENFKVYCAGNQMIMQDGSLNSITYDNWSGVTLKETIGITMTDLHSDTAFQTIVNGENVSTATTCESAEASYQHVISFAGNGISSDKRTAIDQQCAYETANGTGSCSGTAEYDSSQTNLDKYNIQCGVTYTYPSAVMTKEITDNDNDGMDDEWEELRGLNPNDPTDINGDYCGLGYTNIEYYINDLTVNAFPEGVVECSPETGSLEYNSPFEQIEAEDFASQEGIRTEDTTDESGNQNIGFIENGDYVMYKRLDFEDGAKSFTARLSGNTAGIELYLDSLNTPVASMSYAGTGSFSKWETVTFNIPAITGKHNLYIKFTGGEGYLVNMNWFRFNREAVPVNGILAENLLVNDSENASDWKFAENAGVGSLLFGDRDFTWTTLPESLNGAEQILTACDSKNFTGDVAGTAVAVKDITVSVAVDSRVENTPAFLTDWTKTDLTATSSNDVTFVIYQKNFSAGDTLTFGSNGQSYQCVNYTVFLQEKQNSEPVTEPETTEPVTEPEPETVPVLLGDADGSGSIDILDVIVLNKAILGKETLSEQGVKNSDVDGDGLPTSSDALLIMKHIVGLINLHQ
ncbi:MAG: carbohydrate-binding protein [Oscillospiraceae bacterium]|nr:carbohydrate-binding protein [Oscillospiraceae bacterium]